MLMWSEICAVEWLKNQNPEDSGPFYYASYAENPSTSDFLALNLMLNLFKQKIDLKTIKNALLYFPKALQK